MAFRQYVTQPDGPGQFTGNMKNPETEVAAHVSGLSGGLSHRGENFDLELQPLVTRNQARRMPPVNP